MQIAFISIISVALASVAVAAPAKATFKENCAGGQVLNTTTLQAGGHEVKHVTQTCPGLAKRAPSLESSLHKRQADLCGQPCELFCDVAGTPPLIGDCNNLAIDLEALGTQLFLVAPQTASIFTVGTCSAAYINIDTVNQLYCFSSLGIVTADINADCFNVPVPSSDGFCLPLSEVPGSEYEIEIFLN